MPQMMKLVDKGIKANRITVFHIFTKLDKRLNMLSRHKGIKKSNFGK